MSQSVLPAYGLEEEEIQMEYFGSGLINRTWKVTSPEAAYILQRVNQHVFKDPNAIAHNLSLISRYLRDNQPNYPFVAPLSSIYGTEMIYLEHEGFFRMFPFVKGSHSIDVADSPEEAFEAARQFGRFTRMLAAFDVSQLRIPIPRFHDLDLRYQQFLQSLETGNQQRIRQCQQLTEKLLCREDIVEKYQAICRSNEFKLRVTHHDTKISNVLFDADNKGICVIDLDTVMPGYFISDVGDMLRTYLSPVSEEETDFSKIEVRDSFYSAIVAGYCAEMKDELTEVEKQHFFYAGEFMIYMQALRFLTDYFNDDRYYGSSYEGHNRNRAENQLVLLDCLMDKKSRLEALAGNS